MADARGSTASVTIESRPAGTDTIALFSASGTVITFRGFLQAYEEGRDEERNADADPAEAKLPPLTVGQALDVSEAEAKGHETSPPPRYTEASLVKKLEELGVGRPSTYASIISTIVDRGYVTPRGTALVPSWTAFSVVRLLEDFFGDLVEYDFTAAMEDDLDRIADGEEDRVDWLKGFYFGNEGHRGLRNVVDNLGDIDARSINSVEIADDITLRIGKYGPYLEVPDPDAGPDAPPRRVNLPQDLAPDELTEAKARELVDAPVQTDRIIGANPENGKQIVAKDGRFGPYVTELEPETDEAEPAKKKKAVKPRTASSSRAWTSPRSISLLRYGCSTCRGSWGPTRRPARRSPRRTAATVPTSRRARTPARCRARTRSSRSTSTAPWSCSLSPSTAAAPRPPRSRSSRPTPRAASRSGSRRAASAPT
ncbi:hypothetical protein GCM10025866_16780 [Naasia aerilata]|uniref:Topo IA-type catalytic domain-containing protein n=1 Tax=Naasia aerilata TaxID=1162966 RepID=A0ABN6XLD6_9MICO|nr:hypothetical protein GCM10025866_16780 [Naasia aerilata]